MSLDAIFTPISLSIFDPTSSHSFPLPLSPYVYLSYVYPFMPYSHSQTDDKNTFDCTIAALVTIFYVKHLDLVSLYDTELRVCQCYKS